jgi:hypothetical protein
MEYRDVNGTEVAGGVSAQMGQQSFAMAGGGIFHEEGVPTTASGFPRALNEVRGATARFSDPAGRAKAIRDLRAFSNCSRLY